MKDRIGKFWVFPGLLSLCEQLNLISRIQQLFLLPSLLPNSHHPSHNSCQQLPWRCRQATWFCAGFPTSVFFGTYHSGSFFRDPNYHPWSPRESSSPVFQGPRTPHFCGLGTMWVLAELCLVEACGSFSLSLSTSLASLQKPLPHSSSLKAEQSLQRIPKRCCPLILQKRLSCPVKNNMCVDEVSVGGGKVGEGGVWNTKPTWIKRNNLHICNKLDLCSINFTLRRLL